MVSTRLAPAVRSISATSRPVIEMRGASFLSERAYEKYGITAVTRRAEALRSASSVISSSMMWSLTGSVNDCTTKTSRSRTFSWIWTCRLSLEKREISSGLSARPRCAQISAASGRLLLQAKMRRSSFIAAGSPSGRPGATTGARGLWLQDARSWRRDERPLPTNSVAPESGAVNSGGDHSTMRANGSSLAPSTVGAPPPPDRPEEEA